MKKSQTCEFVLVSSCCTGCGGCVDMQPDYVGWGEDMDTPVVLTDTAPREVVAELQALCPEGCFSFDE